MRLCLVKASRANSFMHELIDVVGDTARDLGVEVADVWDAFPATDDGQSVYVLVPHEYFALAPVTGWPSLTQRRRTIAFCTEHPGTEHYEASFSLLRGLGGAVDINRSAAAESGRRGVRAEHFQLGYVRRWDRWGGDPGAERPIEVLYLGSADERRARLLAGYSDVLWRRHCRVLVSPMQPKAESRGDFLVGEAKWDLARASRVLLNLHRGASRAFEWQRCLEAICNGCVVVSEHSDDLDLLVPGVHLVSAQPGSVGYLADHLLDRPDLLARIRDDAYAFVRDELSVVPSVEALLAIAHRLARRPRRIRRGALPRVARTASPPVPAVATEPPPPASDDVLRMAVKQLLLENRQLRRDLQQVAARSEGVDPDRPALVIESDSYDLARPRVTVAIPLHNYQREVLEAMASVAVSDFPELELVVVDDASTDRSAAVTCSFIEQHPWLPAQLWHHPVNRGLPASRNACVARARGEYVFMLDADNRIFPATISRLVAALDADPGASFVYPILAQHRAGGPSGLLSQHAWDPELMRHGNTIDAMALIRREHLLELGGYSEDPRLYGWEDYDLWCRFAESGRYGTLLPEMLGWYRKSEHSMLSLTDIDVRVVSSMLRAHAPRLMSGELTRQGPAAT